jgi:hypothetical protein
MIENEANQSDSHFWSQDSDSFILKDLEVVHSGLFALVRSNSSLKALGKFSITKGSKLIYETIDNVDRDYAEHAQRLATCRLARCDLRNRV